MNDFERKLRETPFRQPPVAWRAETLANAPSAWQSWLWPSPRAWAALAAVWLVILAIDFATTPPVSAPALAIDPPPPNSLLAFHTEHALALLP